MCGPYRCPAGEEAAGADTARVPPGAEQAAQRLIAESAERDTRESLRHPSRASPPTPHSPCQSWCQRTRESPVSRSCTGSAERLQMAGAPHGVQINVNHIRGGSRTYTAQSLIG
eukprot:SAG31_NODE_3310_length_4435_cov_3.950876_1_plen_114_part_00